MADTSSTETARTNHEARPAQPAGQWRVPFGLGLGLGVLLMMFVMEFAPINTVVSPKPADLATVESETATTATLSDVLPEFRNNPDDDGQVMADREIEDDPSGTALIRFINSDQTHFFRDNKKAGQLLILTGRVLNNYPERRGYIHLKAVLMTAEGQVRAERSAYAGNIIEDNLLTTLDMSEIQNRLSIRGGINGANMHIEPGAAVPFMIVFDRLPPDVVEYKIDPASSFPME